jgi:hypothetical protein
MDTKKHPVDDLFRKGLADLEMSPSATGQSQFLKKAKQELRMRRRATSKLWLPGLAIILGISILSGSYIFIKNSTKVQDQKKNVKVNESRKKAGNPTFGIVTRSFIKPTNPQNPVTSANTNSGQLIASRNKAMQTNYHTPITITSSKEVNPENQESYISISLQPSTSSTKDTGQGIRTASTSQPLENKPVSLPEEKEKHSLANNDSSKKNDTARILSNTMTNPDASSVRNDHKHTNDASFNNESWNILAGLYYMPEWIFNSLDRNKYVNNFGAEGTLQYGPYSIGIGIGLSITKAYNETVIETNPYLGSYQKLDSMTYHWDSRHYYLLKTIYTKPQNVYGSTLNYTWYTLAMQYTYLQIPLNLGYDFLEKNWFTLGVRFGPVMSVLLQTQVLTSAYSAGKDKIVMINDISPDRIHLNWQAMAGINAAFRLSHRFILELEPNMRYYFDSVNEKLSPTAKPWSVGLQTSFLVNF